MTQLRIETVNINSLTPDPANARTHDERNISAIADSLRLFGQRKPITVTPDSIVVTGNGTVRAAKSLGWTEIVIARTPVGWTPEQIRAWAIADNQTALLAAWDDKILADQLLELDATGWNLEEIGFQKLEPPLGDLNDDEPLSFDDVPTRSKLGDLWQLGNNRLMCGDSTDKTSVAKLLNGIKADMAFTDPPYGVSYTGGMQFKDRVVEKNNREMIQNDDIDLYADVFPVLADFVNGACYIWFAGTKASNLYTAAEKFGTIHALIIWVKNGGYGALNANYKQKHEPCLYWKPKNANLNFVGETTETTVWNIDKDGINNLHPTQKPIALAMKAIQNHTAKTVLDLFGGSGSTLIACEKTNRSCFMMELDPKYVDVIIKRWENLTGKTAELLED